ncbi:hypothetical protein [Arthrobacter cryoconiti]|uniref:Integral membrane protein n=1 Tax=Arthrobacter cryoconiti TaxID=748907 RepID=A0ABV8R1U8_9MICC|nr:hypothetical protein [Arthrobacter cryoconiti]MCC9068029.1 hypothetical protein [Arthrobacter cryoconiti]
MTEHNASTTPVASERRSTQGSTAILGRLTLRDVVVLGAVLVIFVASLLPVLSYSFAGNLWSLAGLYFLGIGVVLPLSVGVLFTVRRLSPEMKPRIGSLSADQYASVVASFSAAFFFLTTVTAFAIPYVVGLIGALVLLAATVLARWIPVFAVDFSNRTEIPAHLAARDAVPARRRPASPKPQLALPAGREAGKPGAAGFGAAGSAATGQGYAPGQGFVAGQSGQVSQPGQPVPTGQTGGWHAPDQPLGHTPAGQIFTPATGGPTGTQSSSASSTGSHASDLAAPSEAAAGVTSAAGASAPQSSTETAAAPIVATGSGAHSEANSRASAKAPATPEPATGVVPSAQTSAMAAAAPATVMNPKVVDPEVAAPAAETIGATVDPHASSAATQPFWFAVDRAQNVVDERSRQFAFKLAPGSWILALEDRGSSFLVQDSHGKTGVLLDLIGIERAPSGS